MYILEITTSRLPMVSVTPFMSHATRLGIDFILFPRLKLCRREFCLVFSLTCLRHDYSHELFRNDPAAGHEGALLVNDGPSYATDENR
jgi:hypothetical protein